MNIGFRADSSLSIGTGHIHRCLNLARNFKKKKNNSYFLSTNYPDNINYLIKREFKLVELIFKKINKYSLNKKIDYDIKKTIEFIKKFKIDLIFVDNYFINKKWEIKIRKYCKIVLITDYLNRNTTCDYLINYNSLYESSTEDKKINNNNCKKLIGPKYAIIKKYNNLNYKKKEKKKISVFMGGIDTKRYTQKIINVLKEKKFKDYNILIVVGDKNRNKNVIKKETKKYKNFVTVSGNKKSLFNYFENSNLVISNAGTSMYEHMTMGLKSLIIPQSSLQKKICKKLASTGLINFFETNKKINIKNINEILKSNMSQKTKYLLKKLYDGNGSKRIVEYFINKNNYINSKLVKAKPIDVYFLFRLFNDSKVVKNSLGKKKIDFKSHKSWFSKKIQNKYSKIYILKNNLFDIGQIRVDKHKPNKALITYSISNEFRNNKLGSKIIKLALKIIPKGSKIVAIVKKNNLASKRIFDKLLFRNEKNNIKKNYITYQLNT